MEGETKSGPAALRAFCLLNRLLTTISRVERVVIVVGKEETSEVGSDGEARAPAGVGEEELVVCSWLMESWGFVRLSFKSTVKVIKVVFQAQVISEVDGFRFVAVDLSEALSDSQIVF